MREDGGGECFVCGPESTKKSSANFDSASPNAAHKCFFACTFGSAPFHARKRFRRQFWVLDIEQSFRCDAKGYHAVILWGCISMLFPQVVVCKDADSKKEKENAAFLVTRINVFTEILQEGI